MDFIRQQLIIVQDRLRGLSPSQKMLAGTLVIIMAMTMLYCGRFASDRDTVALYPRGIGDAELVAVTNALSARGITFDAAGGQVKVAADKQLDALSAITFAEAMPASDGASALESMLDKLSPLDSQGQFNARMLAVRNKTLEMMMKAWPGVRTTIVTVSESQRGGLTPTPAGATISIGTQPGANASKIAKAALATVLPVIPNLTREGVTVTIDGNPIIAAGSGSSAFAGGDPLEQKSRAEIAIRDSIRNYYNIPGLSVEATADVNLDTKHEVRNTVDPTNKLSLTTEAISEKTQNTEAAAPQEPGTVPNTALDASTASASRGASKTERTEERNENFVGKSETEISTPAGAAKIISAIVRVPREHFEKAWKLRNKGADPTDDQLDTFVTRELGKMQRDVMNKVGTTDPEKVTVTDYVGYEDPTELVANTAVAAGTGGTLSLLAGSHGKEIAIGALALTSLFMVGRMVKKSAPAPVAPLLTLDDMPDVSSGAKKPRKAGTLGGIDIAGEVAEGGSIMMGQELDEEVLETSQMVEQVSGFVRENPDTTAQLLKRWMSRE